MLPATITQRLARTEPGAAGATALRVSLMSFVLLIKEREVLATALMARCAALNELTRMDAAAISAASVALFDQRGMFCLKVRYVIL
jgi:hypothetical protein